MSDYFDSIQNYNSHYIGALRFFENKLVLKLFNTFIKNNGVSLEVGCGNGFYTNELDKKLNCLYKIDKSEVLLNKINTNNKICADYLKYDFNTKFDNIICIGAVEFIGEEFFEKTNQLINNDGICIFCIPKKNIFGYLYGKFYKKRQINLYFFNNDLMKKIQKQYIILHETDFMLNKYLVLKKII